MAGRLQGRICDDMSFTSVPGETECLLAVWTKGGSCGACERSDCYRQGWGKRAVTIDNAARVAKKQLAAIEARARGEYPDV
jgi:hypothetical protein